MSSSFDKFQKTLISSYFGSAKAYSSFIPVGILGLLS
jgi:hypothetical protein